MFTDAFLKRHRDSMQRGLPIPLPTPSDILPRFPVIGAYDEKPEGMRDVARKIDGGSAGFVRFLAERLSDEDWLELREVLLNNGSSEGELNTASDEPEPFSGRPRPGGKMDPIKANDEAPWRRPSSSPASSFDKRFPGASGIKTGFARSVPRV